MNQRRRDHPRRCGENLDNIASSVVYNGSPPQVRGKLSFFVAVKPSPRITPAGAGKTRRALGYNSQSRDHPRRCGENVTLVISVATEIGSPPQVRGKRQDLRQVIPADGITPAGAGKTLERQCLSCGKQDHPRRCGENTKKIL